MTGYCSAKDIARSWGVSERLVQRLCAEGRIEGSQKLGGSWVIPQDASKPEDLRKRWGGKRVAARRGPAAADLASATDAERAGEALDKAPAAPTAAGLASAPASPAAARERYRLAAPVETSAVPTDFAKLMPLMNSPFEPGTCQEAIERFEDPEMRAIARAEFCYFSGNAEEAARIAERLLSHDDLAVRLSACLLYAYANLPLGNINRARFALAELRDALAKSPNAGSAENQAATAFMGYTSSILLHLPLPEDAPAVTTLLPLLPTGLRMFSLYVVAHGRYLKGDYARSLGMAEAALLLSAETYPVSEIYLHLVAVMDCMNLKRTDEAREHLLAAWDLARPDGLIEAFGEHHGLLGGMLESVIKTDWPEDFKRIIDITYRFSAGWRRVHNPATAETVADNLTTTEFAVSMLAARGWTNSEIGRHLDISANTVKSYLTSSFRKLGISKRQELGQFMLR